MSLQTACPDPVRLRELLDGNLPEEEQPGVTGHLESCAACQQTLERLAAGGESWEGAADELRKEPAAADAALGRVLRNLQADGFTDATRAEPAGAADLPLDFLAPPDKPGQLGRLDHYAILEVVGRGGMGVVLKAFDEKLQRTVAVKVLAPQFAASSAARRRFGREARAAAAVAHEHVVAIHAVEGDRPLPYLVMHYVAGVSLQERLDRSGPLGIKEILRIGMQTASGLAAAHAQGLVHRDVKPANILLENGVERVKLTDFGLARAVDDASVTQSGVVAGTPMYMAPEQARGEAVDHRADLFALGSVLYALCTGRPPFRASSAMAVLKRVCDEEPRPVREVNPEVPDWLAAIIARLHAKDPADRFQTAAEVADLLGRHLAHLQAPTQAPMPAPVAMLLAPVPVGRPSGTLRVLLPVAVLLIAVGTMLTVFAWFTGAMRDFGVPAIFLFALIAVALYYVEQRRRRRTAGPAPSPRAPQSPRFGAGWHLWLVALAVALLVAAVIAVAIALSHWTAAPATPRPVADAWVEAVAAMESGRQAEAIREKMSELNPGFNGRHMNLTITEGTAITDVVFSSEDVTDISPLRALRSLHSLECPGPAPVIRGKLADLSPLRGLPLKRLVIHNTEVKDLSPLRDMPLTYLSCYGTNVEDLSPLRGMPLTHLDTGGTHISDLSPLEGMKLTFLHCDHTAVDDLRPLSGMPLQELHCHQTRAASLWPLKDMPLMLLRCDRPERFVLVVRSLRNLVKLNEAPAAAWKMEHAGVHDDASEEDKEALQGAWRLTRGADGGGPLDVIRAADQLVFDGDEIVFVGQRYGPTRAMFKLDAAKAPRAIDIQLAGEDSVPGVYRLDGDTLKLAVGARGGPRPAALAAPWGSGGMLMYFSREGEDGRKQQEAPARPFTVPGPGGKQGQAFETLEEALMSKLGAGQNSVEVEVRGDGPFVAPPFNFGRNAITIRAADGFRPVFVLNIDGVATGTPLVQTDGPLVLEGLEFRRDGATQKDAGRPLNFIEARHSEFHILNCGFVVDPSETRAVCLCASDKAHGDVENCVFVNKSGIGIRFPSPDAVAMSVQQSLFACNCGLEIPYFADKTEPLTVITEHNTFLGAAFVNVVLMTPIKSLPFAVPIAIDVQDSILGGPFRFSQHKDSFEDGKPLPAEEAEAWLRRLVKWDERGGNLYSLGAGADFLDLRTEARRLEPTHERKSLHTWTQFWELDDAGSQAGTARFKGGDLRARMDASPQDLKSDDFRLLPDSPGRRKDGKPDCGADVDLVGPGPAYERWKKTPEYQDWLKAVEESRAK